MQKLDNTSNRKITIIHRNGKSVAVLPAPKKGMVFSLFNFSRTQTSGKNTTTVLTESIPEIPHPGSTPADLTAIKNWVALEEKVIQDHGKQKQVQPKSTVLPSKTPRTGLLRTGLTAFRNWSFPWKRVARVSKRQTQVQLKSVISSPKTAHFNIPRVNRTGARYWIALEEKIVHRYEERRTPWSGSAVPSLAIPRPATSRVDLASIKNRIALEEKTVRDYKEQKTAQPKSAVSPKKTSRPDILRTGLTAVGSWISLGESAVRNYRERKRAQSMRAVPLPRTPEKRSLSTFETFSTQTAVFSSSAASRSKGFLFGKGKIYLKLEKFSPALGWLVAGVLMLLCVQGVLLNRDASRKLSRLQSEKKLLESSLEDQHVKMRWLNGKLQDTTVELKTAQLEINALRNTVQTQNDIVKALKAQSQAFERIIDQGGMSALSGAAAGFSGGQFSAGRTSMFHGEVAAINERQGFIVINVNAAQGAYSGRWFTISRNGRGLAVGRIDRVYPTVSTAVLRNAGMLRVIQEGDSVLFS